MRLENGCRIHFTKLKLYMRVNTEEPTLQTFVHTSIFSNCKLTMVSLFTTSLLLFISSVISAADNDTCGGCSIGAVSIATFWPELFEYLNETVYLFVDLNDNSTSTLSVEPATDARSSYTSICYSAYSSLISQYKDVSACISATSYVNVVYGTSFTESVKARVTD